MNKILTLHTGKTFYPFSASDFSYIFMTLPSIPIKLQPPSFSNLFSPSLDRMFSETESSSNGSIWSSASNDRGDALQEATAMATTAALDSDSNPDTTKVGDERIVVNDSWTTRLSRSLRNYMNPGETAPGAMGNKKKSAPELEALQAVYNMRCNKCTSCNYWTTCTINKSVRCPGCHSTARTHVSFASLQPIHKGPVRCLQECSRVPH